VHSASCHRTAPYSRTPYFSCMGTKHFTVVFMWDISEPTNREQEDAGIFATLLSAIASLPLRALSRIQIAVLLLVSVAGAALVPVTAPGWLPASFVFAGAVIIGAIIGRALPAGPVPMALVLALLSALDIWWIGFGGSALSASNSYTNFSVEFASGVSSIGSLDLVLASAITTHWRRRRAKILVSLAPAPLGMILSNLYFSVTGTPNLALIPFIGAGWLISQLWYRATQKN